MPIKLNKHMRLILALLKVYGPQPTVNIASIAFPGQAVFFTRQMQYLTSTLHKLEAEELVTCSDKEREPMSQTWAITEKGKNLP